ncbi:hypothetical protein SDC9_138839 [bioreactor metagenome]|uniref:Uncharacterized protein n=1 Tax=bioreactor metagenome TaxID=1076179 RepID=A0A645DQV2_9ZZZZ
MAEDGHLFIDIKGIHQADALKGGIRTGKIHVGMFDVHRSDVVRQEHHFITMQLIGIFVWQAGLFDLAHDVNNKVTCAHKGVNDVDILI